MWQRAISIRRDLQTTSITPWSPVRRALRLTLTGAMVGQLGALVSGVFAARMLGPQARGELALLFVGQLVAAQFGSAGLPLALTYELARAPQRASEIVGGLVRPVTLQLVVVTGLYGAVIALLAAAPWAGFALPAFISIGVVPGSLAAVYGLAVLQGKGRFRAFNVVRNIQPTLYSAALLALYVVGAGSLLNVTLTWLVSMLVAGSVSLVVSLGTIRPTSHRVGSGHLREMVFFGMRGLLGSASPVDSFRVDQLIIGPFLSAAALGQYVVGLSFSNFPRLIGQSVGIVAYPHVATSEERNRKRVAWRAIALGVVVCIVPLAVLVPAVGYLVPLLFGKEFVSAVPIARLLLVAGGLAGVRRVAADALRGAGRPGAGSLAEVGAWVTLLVAGPLAAIAWGPTGVAGAVCLSGALALVILSVTMARLQPGRTRSRPRRLGKR